MNWLVIGGTRFVGHHLVDAALAAGHRVTLFNRGQTIGVARPGVADQLKHIQGDRRSDLSALTDPAVGPWDAVIDCCGYLPGEVAAMAQALHGRVGCYLFISSCSVYASFDAPNDETSALGRIEDPHTEVVDGRTYGPLKALCEHEVASRFGASALIVRPGLVVGPHDPTQRFTYWPARIAMADEGEAVAVPGDGADVVQMIDARDLAAFMLTCLHQGTRGVFNAASPPRQWTMQDVLDTCATEAATHPAWVHLDAARLAAAGVAPWTDMPLWLPAQGEYASFALCATARAQAVGLQNRPLAQTIRDTLAWWRSLPADQQAFTKAGLSRERESALLATAA